MSIIVKNKVNTDLRARSGTAFKNNALDTIKTTFTLELETILNVSVAVQVVKLGNVFTLTNGSWSDLIGAFNTANIDFRLNSPSPPNQPTSTTITVVSGADLIIADDGNYSDGVYEIGFFQVTSAPQQFEFFVNLVPNSVATGVNSFLDANVQRLSATLVNALTVSGLTDTLLQLGNKSGGSQFSISTIERKADAVSGNKVYELIVEYKNWMCINDVPYFAGEAVGDYWLFNMFMINNDPSVLISGNYFQTGNTGFENEIFNGGGNDFYNLVSIDWEDDLANPMDAFDYTQNSNFTIVINGNFNAGDDLNLKMFTLPNDATEFQNKPNPIENNLMLASSPALISGGVPTLLTGNLNDSGAGFNIQNLTFTIIATTSVTVTGRVVPNANFTTFFGSRDTQDRRYKIWVLCEDSTLTYDLANTVNVLANDTQAKENIIPLGAWAGMALEYQAHNLDILVPPVQLYLEDDVLMTASFTLPKDLLDNPWLSIRGRIVAEKTNGDRFTLEEFTYNTALLPTNGTTGVLPLNYVENRGFKLPATSDRHNFSVQLDPSLDTLDEFGVEMLYPFIVRYEDWLPMSQASSDFFGSQTQNWFNYSDNPDWTLQFEIVLETADGEYVDPLSFVVHDYNDWGEVTGSELSYELLDTTPVTKPLTDQAVQITASHVIDTEDWTSNQWCVIHIRPDQGAPQWLIGNILDRSDLNNPLYPLTGETKGKITLGTKTITLEANLDPTKIDMTGDITITTRVGGNTTGGSRNNIFKETYTPARTRLTKDLEHRNEGEEDRGYKGCCEPLPVIADTTTTIRNNNDIAFPRETGDSIVFNLTKNGVPTVYVPTAIQFPNQANAWYAQIEWRDVLISDGAGCYSIDMVRTVAGLAQPSINYNTYVLKPYKIDGYLHAKYTARILSEFNDKNDLDGIDYTDSFALESLRITNGKFGYFQPETEVDSVEYLDGRNEKVKTEDFFTYELRVSGITKCVATPLLTHLRGMTNCWMSSYNYDDFDYADLSMKNVILAEGFVAEHIDGARQINGTVKFKDKVFNSRAHFQDNRQTAGSQQPADVCPPSTIVTSTTAKLLKSGQTISYRTGDDGDQENGRLLDWFQLEENNAQGNIFRFGGTTGGYTDGATYFDVNGVGTTKALAFPNDVLIDWSTKHKDDTILAIYFGDLLTGRTWNDAIDWGLALAIDGKSGWRLWNKPETENFIYTGIPFGLPLNYLPITYNLGTSIWTSTSSAQSGVTNAHYLAASSFSTPFAAKTITIRTMASREYTLTELGL